MATSKVLSNQYILWIYPFFLWVGLRKKIVWALCFLIALGSQAIFPYFFEDLVAFKAHAVVVLAVRNVFLLVLFFLVLDWSWFVRAKTEGLICPVPEGRR
jgi:hypothetical protein